MMECFPARGDANGVALQAAPRGCLGFRVVPGVPSKNDSANSTVKQQPGSYPIRVRERGTNRIIPLVNSDSVYFAEEFGKQQGFDLLDVENGDCWNVYLFDSKEDGMTASGSKTRVPVRVADSTAVANGGVPAGNAGWPIRPGTLAVTSYFGGTGRVNELWVRQLDGTWFDTGESFDATGALKYDSRQLAVPGDRFVWVATGAAETVIIEASVEVG